MSLEWNDGNWRRGRSGQLYLKYRAGVPRDYAAECKKADCEFGEPFTPETGSC